MVHYREKTMHCTMVELGLTSFVKTRFRVNRMGNFAFMRQHWELPKIWSINLIKQDFFEKISVSCLRSLASYLLRYYVGSGIGRKFFWYWHQINSQKSLIIKLSDSMKILTALHYRWATLKSKISTKAILIALEVPKEVLP